MAILHLFRGYPGSGKSSAANRMFPGVVRFENDMYLMHDGKYEWTKDTVKDAIAWCTDMVDACLGAGMDVCVANTFTKMRFVMAYEKIALRNNAKFEVYRCQGDFKNVHGLSPKMVESFKNAMEDWPGEILVEPI